ncbi:MAG: phosphoadenosine phosphosulfate reductase [Paenibacillaceae bacterium]|nr:phosphoadenosine phosphosulfate reductase [Paenibacillaceae bacterium]
MKLTERTALIQKASDDLESRDPQTVLAWAVDQFPKIVLACSFGAEDVVLVDMLLKIKPEAHIFYLDTGLHFKETYETKDRLEHKYQTRFIQVLPKLTLKQQEDQYGARLWSTNPDGCCAMRKVNPLTEILKGYEAWITGIRRDQAPTRANAGKVEYDVKFGLTKINPLADWTNKQVWKYIQEENIPYNPLHDQDYPSIGCEPCTMPVKPGDDPRAGRWSGTSKTECGLHK